MILIFATRPSRLARWQTQRVIQLLAERWPDLAFDEIVVTTRGDRVIDQPLPEIGGKGLFTYELEQAMLAGQVQAAVHSLKDLPTEDHSDLAVAAVPPRADPRDVLICPAGHTLDDLPERAVVGTSSVRRRAQVLAHRPDLIVRPIRGNVDTRLRKVAEGEYDAIVLAAAGVERLGSEDQITQFLSFDTMLPAPGQGAMAVQCPAGDETTRKILQSIEHLPSRVAVTAERTFLNALGGGCSLPVGAHATFADEQVALRVIVTSPDGDRAIRLQARGEDPQQVGLELADRALRQGAQALLDLVGRSASSP